MLVVFLAAIGFYGTQRYLVTAGRREYAIRSALGAGPRSLGRLVIARGMRLGLPGLIFGIILAFLVVACFSVDECPSRGPRRRCACLADLVADRNAGNRLA
jgi:ABC-type antimicrobial peptide transport system permease subunit